MLNNLNGEALIVIAWAIFCGVLAFLGYRRAKAREESDE